MPLKPEPDFFATEPEQVLTEVLIFFELLDLL